MRAQIRVGSVLLAVGLAVGLAGGLGAAGSGRAAPATAAVGCPPGQDVTTHGIAGGYGCRPRHEVETAAEAMTVAAQDAFRHAGATASDRLAGVAAYRAMAARPAAVAVPDSGQPWRSVGPRPLHVTDPVYDPTLLGWTTVDGRVTSIAIDPRDKNGNTVYLGTAAGGVWRSVNAGKVWTPVGDALPTLSVGAVAVDPANGAVIVGTGEGNTSSDSYLGAGVYRSTTGTGAWKHSSGVPASVLITHIEIAGTHVYVGTSSGLYRSSDSGRTFVKASLPTNTANTAPATQAYGSFVTDVRVKPGTPTEVTAAVGWRSGGIPSPGLYRSTNSGATWSKLATVGLGVNPVDGVSADPIGRISLAYSADGSALWAVVQDPGKLNKDNNPVNFTTPTSVPPSNLNGVYRSLNDGMAWALKGSYHTYEDPATNPGSALQVLGTALSGPGVQAWYNNYVLVDPADANRVLVGLEEIYMTTVGGDVAAGEATWKTVGRYWNNCAGLVATEPYGCPPVPGIYGGTTTHPDQHAAAAIVLPNGKTRFYVGNDGGAYRQDVSSDPTNIGGLNSSGWTSLNDTLSISQPYAAAMSGDGTIVAGLQDNGEAKILPSGRADMIYGGDGFDTAIAPDNSNLIYEEYATGQIRRSANGGKTWTTIEPNDATGPRFSTPFELDPLDAQHMAYGAAQIWETTHAPTVSSSSWVRVFNLDATAAVVDNIGTCRTVNAALCPAPDIAATAVDTYGKATYAAYCKGACNITTADGSLDPTLFTGGIATNVKAGCGYAAASTACWHLAAGKGLPKRFIQGVQIDRKDPRTVYVAMSAYSRHFTVVGQPKGSIFVSHDAGEHFTDISGNLPKTFGEDVQDLGDRIVAATDVGVFAALKSRPTVWVPFGTKLPAVPAYELSLNPQGTTLVLATHGRGVYTLALKHAVPKATRGSGSGRRSTGGGLAGTGLPWSVPATAVLLIAAALTVMAVRRRRA
jgi:hypothetical protein